MRPFTHDSALFDDVEMLNRAVGGFDDALAGGIKTQLTLLDQVRQVSVFHLIEGREALKELQSALNVLQYRGFSCLCEGVRFTHNHDRNLLLICCWMFRPWSAPTRSVPIGRKSR